MFKPKTTFVPARIEEPEMEDEDQSPIVIPMQPKQKRYCGEKLLRKLHKDRKKEKSTRNKVVCKTTRSRITSDFNIDQITRSLSNIMSEITTLH